MPLLDGMLLVPPFTLLAPPVLLVVVDVLPELLPLVAALGVVVLAAKLTFAGAPSLVPLFWRRQVLSALPCSPAQWLAIEVDSVDAVPEVLLVVCAPTMLAAASADTTSNALGVNFLLSCFMLPPFIPGEKPIRPAER